MKTPLVILALLLLLTSCEKNTTQSTEAQRPRYDSSYADEYYQTYIANNNATDIGDLFSELDFLFTAEYQEVMMGNTYTINLSYDDLRYSADILIENSKYYLIYSTWYEFYKIVINEETYKEIKSLQENQQVILSIQISDIRRTNSFEMFEELLIMEIADIEHIITENGEEYFTIPDRYYYDFDVSRIVLGVCNEVDIFTDVNYVNRWAVD